MSEEITPALTPEQWGAVHRHDDGAAIFDWPVVGAGPSELWTADDRSDARMGFAITDPRAGHALAALALHGQPYGFTHADVAMAREAARVAEFEGYDDIQQAMSSIAARLAALLPPA